jgi:hypothetical protein
MFLGNECAQDSQSIANLSVGFFQSVYMRDDWIPDSDLPTPDDSHKMSTIEISDDEFECAFYLFIALLLTDFCLTDNFSDIL